MDLPCRNGYIWYSSRYSHHLLESFTHRSICTHELQSHRKSLQLGPTMRFTSLVAAVASASLASVASACQADGTIGGSLPSSSLNCCSGCAWNSYIRNNVSSPDLASIQEADAETFIRQLHTIALRFLGDNVKSFLTTARRAKGSVSIIFTSASLSLFVSPDLAILRACRKE